MTSRIVVKNCPKHAAELRLRNHFAAKGGEITDIKLLMTKNNTSRQICFIGFKTAKQAEEAVDYFNGTFMDTSRLIVEKAMPPGDKDLKRPWSKYSVGSSLHDKREQRLQPKQVDKKTTRNKTERKIRSAEETDAAFAEFMSAMKPRSTKSVWSNDDGLVIKAKVPARRSGGEGILLEKTHVVFKDNSSNNDGDDRAEEHEKIPFDGDDDDDDDEDVNDVIVEKKKQPEEEQSRHKSDNRVPSTARVQPDGEDGEDDDDDAGSNGEKEHDECRLFFRNLPYTATAEELSEFIQKSCPGVTLKSVHIVADKESKVSKGLAFVLFQFPSEAESCRASIDNKIFQGRLLHVLQSRPAPATAVVDSNGGGGPATNSAFKKEKEKKKKQDKGNTSAWNPLFMLDSAADAIAVKLAVRKSDILDADADNMAVRMALGETKIIDETRKVLEKEGVRISAFEGMHRSTPRSKTALLVKNIPHDTLASEVRELFQSFGTILRLVIPPTHTMALLEFAEANDAKRAFDKLAYSRFKQRPLYLEWAPLDCFDPLPVQATTTSTTATHPTTAGAATVKTSKGLLRESEVGEATRTLLVRNLNFDTTEAKLRSHFAAFSSLIRKATIPTKEGGKLSSGFGFVEFIDDATAEKALKSLQGSALDGHSLQLLFAKAVPSSSDAGNKKNRSKAATNAGNNAGGGGGGGGGDGEEEEKDMPKDASSKLVIRNIPFEADKREIVELFASFGTLKQVRLPKKFDGTHRGFCFVDYATKQQAVSARQALAFTHFYGRHLVSEFAKDDDSVEALRRKAKKDLESGSGRGGKRRKIAVDDDDDSAGNEGDDDGYD